MEKLKKISVLVVFLVVIFGLAIWHIFLPDLEISRKERRKLDPVPKFTATGVMDGSVFSAFESYLLDQFPCRDSFREIKALTNRNIFQVLDNNGMYLVQDNLMHLEFPLKQNQVQRAVAKIEQMIQKHPQMAAAYISVIPDKNYFMAAQNGYPSMEYETLFSMMKEIPDAQYVSLVESLNLNSYYRTDSHWRQECILPAANKLCAAMGAPETELSAYEQHTLSPFYGVYASQSAIPVAPEQMSYLTNAALEHAVVKSVEQEDPIAVYLPEEFYAIDPYDLFLSGPEAVITIENPAAATHRELILFRDSFGSSIAPLFAGVYQKVTLVDLRYISSDLVDQYVDFNNADVLFLYSTTVLNAGGILK